VPDVCRLKPSDYRLTSAYGRSVSIANQLINACFVTNAVCKECALMVGDHTNQTSNTFLSFWIAAGSPTIGPVPLGFYLVQHYEGRLDCPWLSSPVRL